MQAQKIKYFILALCLCVCLTACVRNNAGVTEEPAQVANREDLPANKGLFYTNLVDKDVQDEVKSIMIQAGMEQSDIEEVFSWIDTYNKSVQGLSTFKLASSFVHIDAGYVWYGSEEEYLDVNRQWWKVNNFSYYDVLCRSTAYYLMRDFIAVSNPVPQEDWHVIYDDNDCSKCWLVTDMDGFKTNPNIHLSDEEITTYFSLFNPITLSADSPKQDMYDVIKQEWTKRGVTFKKEDSSASLVTIWSEEMGIVGVSHAAVLIENREGLLLFEKTNPEYPYQATKFQNLNEVKEYMINQLNSTYEDGAGEVVVMKNDMPM